MPPNVNVELLFSVPRTELHSRLVALLNASHRFSAVVGFLTEEGVSLIEGPLAARPHVVSNLVVGAATLKACDGIDRLRAVGVQPDRLRIHLGHSRRTRGGFVKYHPMMHSKVYLFEGPERCTAIVGSHNLTGFAIGGQNTEASVLVEGPPDDPLIQQARDHIAAVSAESQPYDPNMRAAYAWWFKQAFDGMRYKVLYGTGEDDVEHERNVLAIAVRPAQGLPQPGEVVYLEVPSAFKMLKALGEPVHFYLLAKPPVSVAAALDQLPSCDLAFHGEVIGTNERVVKNGEAHWRIRDLMNPVLERTNGRVSPTTGPGEVQAFVEIKGPLDDRYVYIFESPGRWQPVYDDSADGTILAASDLCSRLAELNLIPAEHLPWHKVVGLTTDQGSSGKIALERDVSPESGRYLLFSKGRKSLHAETRADDAPRLAAQTAGVPGEVWFAVAAWAKEKQLLHGKQRGIAYSLGELVRDRRAPSDRQAAAGKKLLLEAVRLGFTHPALTEDILKTVRAQP